jgi:hypothetical protein
MIMIRDLAAGDWDRPIADAEESVATWRRAGDRFRLADAPVWLAVIYARAGRRADALALAADQDASSAQISRQSRHPARTVRIHPWEAA